MSATGDDDAPTPQRKRGRPVSSPLSGIGNARDRGEHAPDCTMPGGFVKGVRGRRSRLEEAADGGGGLAAKGDGSDDKGCSQDRVARGEDARGRSHVVGVHLERSAVGDLEAEVLDEWGVRRPAARAQFQRT